MADEQARPHPHIYLRGTGTRRGYTAYQAGGDGGGGLPQRDRVGHANALTQALTAVVQQGETVLANRDANIAAGEKGFYVEFTLPSGQADIVDKLENRRGRFPIELVNVHPAEEGQVSATVFVPEAQKDYYLRKVAAYRDDDNVTYKTHDDGFVEELRKPKNQRLIASIETARLAVARSFYTDQANLFPAPGGEAWWEVWVRKGTKGSFDKAAQALGMVTREHTLEFAERDVVIAKGTPEQLGRVIANTDSVAELRLARDTPSLFMGMDGAEQRTWSADLAKRLVPIDDEAPAVCLLDSGTTINHPLIKPYLLPVDQQAFDAAWNAE
ncbi:MAG: hypothetical protein EOO77_30460, partial [Oxalobacteraceae bacterium]